MDQLEITLAEEPVARAAQLTTLYDEITANLLLAEKRLLASAAGIRFLQQLSQQPSLDAAASTVAEFAGNLSEITMQLKADRTVFVQGLLVP